MTYRDAVRAVLGDKAGNVLATATTSKCFAACLMYTMIVGDTTSSLAVTLGLPTFFQQRNFVLPLLSAIVLAPLCLLRSFGALQYTSLLGIAGTIYTCFFMGIRYFDQSYAPGGRFFSSLPVTGQPLFGSHTSFLPSLVLVSMLSTAFVAHYNAPKYYIELRNRSTKRFSFLSLLAFGASMAIFGAIMGFGFLTFGRNCNGLSSASASASPLLLSCHLTILPSCHPGSYLLSLPSTDQESHDMPSVLTPAFLSSSVDFLSASHPHHLCPPLLHPTPLTLPQDSFSTTTLVQTDSPP